ncbi:hypothetical protein BpHYR1_029010 [Brachionus plicatilis]|uniref:Uncharacterized protein n=1 Tax=Brachionus plicatilis TaxID=10195 RepID=A0A3M7SWI1_BRAPC|nr:hypothetical protein BpHYR1_029010 [Brachionus plicatilis]
MGITNVQPSIFECIKQNITLCPSKSNNSFETDIQALIKHFNELKEHFFISDDISDSIRMCLENIRFKDYRLDEFHNLRFTNFIFEILSLKEQQLFKRVCYFWNPGCKNLVLSLLA